MSSNYMFRIGAALCMFLLLATVLLRGLLKGIEILLLPLQILFGLAALVLLGFVLFKRS